MDQITPRILRKRDAPSYLGMCPKVFDKLVRPYVTTIPIGEGGIGFDRLELDEWLDKHKALHGIKPIREIREEELPEKVFKTKPKPIKKNHSSSQFDAALASIMDKKRKHR